jgi:hypothetical protein
MRLSRHLETFRALQYMAQPIANQRVVVGQ